MLSQHIHIYISIYIYAYFFFFFDSFIHTMAPKKVVVTEEPKKEVDHALRLDNELLIVRAVSAKVAVERQGWSTTMVKRHRLLEGHIEDPPQVPFSGVLCSIILYPANPDFFSRM